MNYLLYTLTVIKETLRIFLVVIDLPRNIVFYGPSITVSTTIPSGGRESTIFLPERFLRDQDHNDELRPLKNVWRPFEYGSRACIGTELAMTELKIVLALTTREFELKEAYAEWDRTNRLKGMKTVDEERAY
ncbi:hypothetical protein K458DRAFT_389859 [Lentithecium fluviatile CBS 122367]|uniref:Cytochrome P450 n=1 Tax=Lentithecium fluviatile CBS 122367 TaxID=1168545 RepID=A0A6G1IZ81_9PLEO|nr:hypothetical protein K458DRAFT_389859 [Lentithecium fluviatile CBS 122367]